jgi:hypothetical protein
MPYTVPPEAMGFRLAAHPNSLQAHVDAGRVVVERARGDSFGSRALHLVLRNATAGAVSALVERGCFFHNLDCGLQPLICAEDASIELEPHGVAERRLDAFCGVSRFGCPKRSDMALSPYVMAEPGAMASQSTLWKHLLPFYIENSGAGSRAQP